MLAALRFWTRFLFGFDLSCSACFCFRWRSATHLGLLPAELTGWCAADCPRSLGFPISPFPGRLWCCTAPSSIMVPPLARPIPFSPASELWFAPLAPRTRVLLACSTIHRWSLGSCRSMDLDRPRRVCAHTIRACSLLNVGAIQYAPRSLICSCPRAGMSSLHGE